MIKIVCDSGSDITQAEAASKGYTVLPIAVSFNGKEYRDGIDLSPAEFYELIKDVKKGEDLPKTAQVPPFMWEEEFAKAKENGDQIIAVSLGSGFSGGYNSLCLAAQEYEDVAYPVDSRNVSMGECAIVYLADKLIKEGASAEDIQRICNERALTLHCIAGLETLDFLKYGGRISKAVAFVGGILKIKPIVAVLEGKVRLVGKGRGNKFVNKSLVEMVEKNKGVDEDMPYVIGYTGLNPKLCEDFVNDDSKKITKVDVESFKYIGPTIGTHVGPDCVCFAYWGKEDHKPFDFVMKAVAKVKKKTDELKSKSKAKKEKKEAEKAEKKKLSPKKEKSKK